VVSPIKRLGEMAVSPIIALSAARRARLTF